MTAAKKLSTVIENKKSLLCVGLDIDPDKVPKGYNDDLKGLFRFALKIIEATSELVVAYKPNLGFYEAFGPEGLSLLKMICSRIPDDTILILDGKRGDIGNTAAFYARAAFDIYKADWTTVNPYMGYDSIRPFLENREKGAFVLCLTSNPGAMDFQRQEIKNRPLYYQVARKVASWDKENNCGLVVGATYPEQLVEVRQAAENMPILIPGVGAQGGDLEKAVLAGTDNFTKTAVINVSRSVLYASKEENFDQAARNVVISFNREIDNLRRNNNRPSDNNQ